MPLGNRVSFSIETKSFDEQLRVFRLTVAYIIAANFQQGGPATGTPFTLKRD